MGKKLNTNEFFEVMYGNGTLINTFRINSGKRVIDVEQELIKNLN